MGRSRAPAVMVLLVLASFASSQEGDSGTPDVVPVARLMAADGYSAVASEINLSGTYLGLPPVAAARALVSPAARLEAREQETLMLALLARTARATAAERELLAEIAPRVASMHDWSLVAAVLERGVEYALPGARDLLDIADRIVAALGAPDASRAGYETAAVALSAVVIARDGLPTGDGSANGTHAPAVRTALAESLRLIARGSRSLRVVEQARDAATALLDPDGHDSATN